MRDSPPKCTGMFPGSPTRRCADAPRPGGRRGKMTRLSLLFPFVAPRHCLIRVHPTHGHEDLRASGATAGAGAWQTCPTLLDRARRASVRTGLTMRFRGTCFQGSAHGQHAKADPALHRPERRGRPIGDLLLGQSAEIGASYGLAPDVRSGRERSLHDARSGPRPRPRRRGRSSRIASAARHRAAIE